MDSPEFVTCVSNDGYPAALERRKVYRRLSDVQAEAHQLLRVIDETGEDYLYPASFFAPISLPQATVEALGLAV
jgi:hypothetical protein